jgi:hypothetical protein
LWLHIKPPHNPQIQHASLYSSNPLCIQDGSTPVHLYHRCRTRTV